MSDVCGMHLMVIASGYHWRRNVNVLAAAGYRVYAIDLVGFGLSSKPVIDYDSRLWREQ